MYQKIVYHLRNYQKYRIVITGPPKREIKALASLESKYHVYNNNVVLLGREKFKKWLTDFKKDKFHNALIREKANYELSNYKDPYLYKFPDESVIMIQNTPNLTEAITISNNWNLERINNGFDNEKIGEPDSTDVIDLLSYTLYGIKFDKIEVLEAVGENPTASVLKYQKPESVSRYAAILPIISLKNIHW